MPGTGIALLIVAVIAGFCFLISAVSEGSRSRENELLKMRMK